MSAVKKAINQRTEQRGNMIVNRTDKNHGRDPFTQISNSIIYDSRLELKEKALMLHILSKPENWTLNIDEIINCNKDGKAAVYAGLKRLKELGYIILSPIYNENKKIDYWEYTINENPGLTLIDGNLKAENLHPEKLLLENQEVGNRTYNNININKKYINKINQSKEQNVKEDLSLSVNEPPKVVNLFQAPVSDLTDDFLKKDEKEKKEVKELGENKIIDPEKITRDNKTQNLIDDLMAEPFDFSEDAALNLLKEYGFEKLEYFTREVCCKHFEGKVHNPPAFLRTELKKYKFTFIKSLEQKPAPVPVQNRSERFKPIYDYFWQKKLITAYQREHEKQDIITKALLKKFQLKDTFGIECELINIIGDLSLVTDINILSELLQANLQKGLNQELLNQFIGYWKELIK